MNSRTFRLSLAHAGVDLACAALYFGFLFTSESWWSVLLFYNAFAFAAQMPMGLLADTWNHNLLFAAIGCVLVMMAYPFASIPLAAATLAGIGNGAFHVGAGLQVLNDSREKAGPLGVFVSPGAIGLFVGTAFAHFWRTYVWIVVLLLIGCILLIMFSKTSKSFLVTDNAPFAVELPSGAILPLVALFLVVCLRSFLGMTDAFSAASIPKWIAVLCVAGGKATGGLLGDRIGISRTSVLSLGVCTVLLLIPHDFARLLAVFLFNMTMPITLWGAARHLKNAKGFSFGLLTFALFLGFLPKLLRIRVPNSVLLYAGTAAVSLVLLIFGLKGTKA